MANIVKHFYIDWLEPIKINWNRENDQYAIPELDEDILLNTRMYTIYGRHPVYGPNSLLYIGETKKSKNGKRSIQSRLREHFTGRFWYHTELEIRLGTIYDFKDDSIISDEVIVQSIESLLIATHVPALNRKYIDGPLESASDIHIVNYGFYGSLVPECSGLGFS